MLSPNPRIRLVIAHAATWTGFLLRRGTFSLTDEPLDQPPLDLIEARAKQRLEEDAFSVLKIGETRRIENQVP